MQIINRKGHYNDVMFGDMAEFAQHQIVTSAYKHTVKLIVDGVESAIIEDVRIIFNKPGDVQAKFRVAECKHKQFNKNAVVQLVIEAKAPSKEPSRTILIEKWFEETSGLVPNIDQADVVITPNKWLYIEGKEQ